MKALVSSPCHLGESLSLFATLLPHRSVYFVKSYTYIIVQLLWIHHLVYFWENLYNLNYWLNNNILFNANPMIFNFLVSSICQFYLLHEQSMITVTLYIIIMFSIVRLRKINNKILYSQLLDNTPTSLTSIITHS